MIKKLIVFLFVFCISVPCFGADFFSTHYNLRVPEQSSRDWISKISNDVISIDTALFIMSQDINAMTTDTVSTVGGVVGRMKIVSDDGSVCYILLYSPN